MPPRAALYLWERACPRRGQHRQHKNHFRIRWIVCSLRPPIIIRARRGPWRPLCRPTPLADLSGPGDTLDLTRARACRSSDHDPDFRTPVGSGPPRRQAAQPADSRAGGRIPCGHRCRAQGPERRAGRPLLLRPGHPGAGRRNRRLRVRLAGNGPLRQEPPGRNRDRCRCTLHGRDGENPHPGKARADADPGGHLLARPGLPGRRVLGLLRPAPRAYRGGLRQHFRCREGPRRLGGDLELCTGNRRKPDGQRRDHHLGPGQAPGDLHPAPDRCRHAAVGRCLHRSRRVQVAPVGRHEGAVPGCGDSGAPRVAGSGDRAGRRGGLHQPADQGCPDPAEQDLHRRHRPRHLLQDAAAVPGQGVRRSPHRR
ncbi:hypothetical protein D3C72_407650 [compost metagenome]